MANLDLLGVSKNGQRVLVDRQNSHAATHLDADPGLEALVVEAIGMIELGQQDIYQELDMGRTIGTTDCVATNGGDVIVYAKRKNRETYTRFVKGKEPVDTCYIALSIKYVDQEVHILHSAWIGRKTPPFPDSPAASADSVEFWSAHALVWGREAIAAGTETTDCPW